MPIAAPRPCTYPGCLTLVGRGCCTAHAREQAQQYHDPDIQRLYKTARWARIRRAQLTNQPWCEECLRANIYAVATDVDHITPHRGDPVKFFRGPFQSMCHACHSRKTASEVLNV